MDLGLNQKVALGNGFQPCSTVKVSVALAGLSEKVIKSSTKYRLGVDHALPLSDHADYDQLVETVRRVEPSEIFCTHGPPEFADHLRDLGFNAYPLHPPAQRRLFC